MVTAQRPDYMGKRQGLWATKLCLSITPLCPNLSTTSPGLYLSITTLCPNLSITSLCPYLSIASDSLTIWAMSPLWIFCCTSSSWALVHLYLTWERQQ